MDRPLTAYAPPGDNDRPYCVTQSRLPDVSSSSGEIFEL